MKLQKIQIENYKSIEYLEIPIEQVNGSSCFGLLGINESGKSNILRALSLINEDEEVSYPNDFFNDNNNIKITLTYSLIEKSISELNSHLFTKFKFPKELAFKINFIEIVVEFEPKVNSKVNYYETVDFENKLYPNYTIESGLIVKKLSENKEEKFEFDIEAFFKDKLKHYFWYASHYFIYWESSPEYLKLDNISLDQFKNKPEDVSIPLLNCFKLIDINKENLIKEINKLNNPVSIASIQAKLSNKVTEYINKIWPEHPISINFQIINNEITLLVEDKNVLYKPKTTSQRSDGFKQFVSFLLTISIENNNDELYKTVLLIDEPEVHLHPPAQISLLNELIKITSNDRNNLLFFATHSNYLIDKTNLDRYFKVFKHNNEYTKIKKIEKKNSTYSEVNYEVSLKYTVP